MANLSKFHIVFSSSTLIHLNKDAFEVHLCQTVNNFVKQNKSHFLLSPQGVNDPGVIGKVLASSFEWYVNCQHPESLKISLASLVYTDQC